MTAAAFAPDRPGIVFLVSHLSGTGHLVRILALAEAVAAAGGRPVVISGGRPLAHLDTRGVTLHQLPWIAVAGRDFTRPLDSAGRPADAALLAGRAAEAAAIVAAEAPAVLVCETWPLGRRRLSQEYEAAIGAARALAPRPARIAVSLRDLPEPPSKAERRAEAEARLAAHVDLVLVHGDAGFLPLSTTWPLSGALADRLRHAGYVRRDDTAPSPIRARPAEILVGVGGGDLGRHLLAIAAGAAAHSHHPWRLRAGGPDAAALSADLARTHAPAARAGLVVEPPAADWRPRLAGSAAAVTLAGYNTVTDLAPLDVPALLVPDETGGEREQALRAGALATLPGIETMAASALDPARLAAIADRLAGGPRRAPLPITLDGAARAARHLLDLARGDPA